MRRTNIYLDEEQTAVLDRRARQEAVSRAELIRRLLDGALGGADAGRTVDVDLCAIEGSFGVLRDLDVGPRSPGDRERHLAEIWGHQR